MISLSPLLKKKKKKNTLAMVCGQEKQIIKFQDTIMNTSGSAN